MQSLGRVPLSGTNYLKQARPKIRNNGHPRYPYGASSEAFGIWLPVARRTAMLIRKFISLALISIALTSSYAADKGATSPVSSTPPVSDSLCEPTDSKVSGAGLAAVGDLVAKTKNCCTGDKCSDKAYCDNSSCKCKRKPTV